MYIQLKCMNAPAVRCYIHVNLQQCIVRHPAFTSVVWWMLLVEDFDTRPFIEQNVPF